MKTTMRTISGPAAWCMSALMLVMCVWASGCSDDGPEQVQMMPQHRGERGESCQARNECAEGLACVNEVCVRNDYAIGTGSGQCVIIECEADQDCCEQHPNCPDLEEACDDGDEFACDDYDYYCTCDAQCVDNMCQQDTSCEDNIDCGGGYCDDGSCVQCMENDDCSGNDQCVDGFCKEGCEVDTNCPLFQSCEQGQCVETGCQSDRECVIFAQDGDAICQEGSCVVPCTSDAECNAASNDFFQVCDNNQCVFVGCETDNECRIALGMADQEGSLQTRCESGD